MKKIWVIKAESATEFNSGRISEWSDSKLYYGFENYEEAIEEVEKLQKEEETNYRRWLQNKKGSYLHQDYNLESLIIY